MVYIYKCQDNKFKYGTKQLQQHGIFYIM